ncbi:MAG: competence protein TfoX [Candidatus Gallimonas sp.]
MATDRAFAESFLETCGCNVRLRPMMGEYLVFYNEKTVGGLYDNRLLVKSTPSARQLLSDARRETPYVGAKEMLRVEEPFDGARLATLFLAVSDEIPSRKGGKT